MTISTKSITHLKDIIEALRKGYMLMCKRITAYLSQIHA